MTQTVNPFGSSLDGQRLTVNMLIKQPAIIRARMLSMLDQMFITDAILREGPAALGGAVVYNESTPLFADEDPSVVAEFGEIPVIGTSLGIPHAVYTVKRALGVEISEEMRRRDDMGAVDMKMTQARNTMVRAYERLFLNTLLNNAGVHTMAATAVWSSGSSKIRFDLAQAEYLVTNSDTDSTDNTGTNKLGFNPDTLIISTKTRADFKSSDDIAKVFVGNIANENIQYKGAMPGQFFGFDVLTSWQLPANTAVLLERKTVGGISDERPMTVKPLREQPDNETWRQDIIRQSAIFIDQPKAACVITGV